jgi:thiamine pyrophosphokinase
VSDKFQSDDKQASSKRKSCKRAYIYCSGTLSGYDPDEFLIAVDGGSNHLFSLDVIPDLVIGDMDSIEPSILEYYRSQTEIVSYSSLKDESDTELAILWCLEKGFNKVTIINNMQGYFAHTIGLISLLFLARKNGVEASIVGDKEIVILADKEFSYRAPLHTKISLVPLTTEVSGIITRGLLYPLQDESLFFDRTRGLSNVFVDDRIDICYNGGELLLVVEKTI